MITRPSRNPSRLHPVQWLLMGLLLGYVSFIGWLGVRIIVLLSGGMIVGFVVALWYLNRDRHHPSHAAVSANLLETDVFISCIGPFSSHIPAASQSQWRAARLQAQAIQEIAQQIAQQESTFIPDLLDTLYTVLELTEQLAQALQVTHQVQTPRYRELAQYQLKSSQARLQQTHDQLQELRDQMALADLEWTSRKATSGISTRLQIITAENAKGLLGQQKP